MDTENEEVTKETDMPEELAAAFAKALVKLHARIVKQAEQHFSKMEETATCESNSDAQPC
jgi:hypothetical protein